MQNAKFLIQLGARVKKLRESRSWSQEEFAAKADVARSFAGAIERGEKDIRMSTLLKLAAALDVSPANLLKD
jgi:XRE family transcriptional regulator, regulator of sulfur utilization